MKPNIHPEYRPVAFVDLSINKTFIIPSAVQTRETVEIDGVTYPLFKLDTSSASHPFYTGAQTRIVEAGRVEKFRAKFAAKKQALNTAAEAAKTTKSFVSFRRRILFLGAGVQSLARVLRGRLITKEPRRIRPRAKKESPSRLEDSPFLCLNFPQTRSPHSPPESTATLRPVRFLLHSSCSHNALLPPSCLRKPPAGCRALHWRCCLRSLF